MLCSLGYILKSVLCHQGLFGEIPSTIPLVYFQGFHRQMADFVSKWLQISK